MVKMTECDKCGWEFQSSEFIWFEGNLYCPLSIKEMEQKIEQEERVK